MREAALAISILLALCGVAWTLQAASWLLLLYVGVGLVLVGLAFSTPCAVMYHLRLYQALHPRGALDRRWLWNPTGQHGRLTGEERRRVMPWFYAGAVGWVVAVAGCLFAGASVLALR